MKRERNHDQAEKSHQKTCKFDLTMAPFFFSTFSVDDQNHCGSETCQKKMNIFVPIVASISSVLVLLIAFLLIWSFKRIKQSGTAFFYAMITPSIQGL